MTDIPDENIVFMQDLADSVQDSELDSIEPRSEKAEPKDRESTRRSVIADLMDKQGLRGKREKAEKPPKPPKAKKELPPRRKGSLTRRLTEFYTFLGMSVMPFDAICGAAVVNSAEQCAEALDNLAYENEAVRRALHALLETSAWGQVVMAHTPILLAIGSHHVPAVQRAMVRMAGAATAREAEDWLHNGNGVNPE